jgi:2-keto-myo-inositol isomerase
VRPSLTFAINHMVAPRRTLAELVALASALGLDAVEIRNDLDGVPIADGTEPGRIRDEAKAAGVRILSINALQRFNEWSDARAAEAVRLASYARECGAAALVLCPVNDINYHPSEARCRAGLRQALQELAPILAEAGITGLVEPLGFKESSLRLKAEAIEAIDELGQGERFRVIHDTFHHYLAGETRTFPERTGLVHISGVEDHDLPLNRIRDAHRVLVGPKDLLGNLAQIRALGAGGYTGPYSFEPFAASVHTTGDIAGALHSSMRYIESGLATASA